MPKKEKKIPEVLVWTDINNYSDDLASLVILAYLADLKLINIRGIITQLGTYEVRRRRAIFAKGAMAHLGYPFVRAVPGGDYDIQNEELENHYIENDFTDVIENAGVTVHRSGTIFLQEYMKTVKDKSVYILLNAPFDDFVKYIKATHDTVLKKIKKVVVMGSVLQNKDEHGYYLPNLECYNFKYCQDAAKYLFDYAQNKGLRMTVVPALCAEHLEMDYGCLDNISKSRNPVYQELMLLKDAENPTTMAYDMLSTLCLIDGLFKACGGRIQKDENSSVNISFADVENAQLMRDKFCEIFKEKLETKTISMDHLKRSKGKENYE